jgi:hypothetical protein
MKSKGWLFIMFLTCLQSCSNQVTSLELDPVSFALIDTHALKESNSDYNVVFIVAGKSCFVCSEDIIDYINEFDCGKYELTVIGNDPQIEQALVQKSTYKGIEQLELERHGFKMSDSEIYIFIGDDLIYKNILKYEEFGSINAKMKELNE